MYGRRYSVRTINRRFTAWVPFNNSTLRVNWNRTSEALFELYDLTGDTGRDFDFDAYSTNLAVDKSYGAEVANLLAELRAQVETWY